MKIILLRTWITNIGNGFIDKGARVILEKAFPEAEIVEVSGFPDYTAGRKDDGWIPDKVSNLIGWSNSGEKEDSYRRRAVNVSQYLDADLAVLPGCILYDHVLEKYFSTLSSLSNRDIPILFLGAGGGDYEPGTQRYVKKIIEDINPIGLISRDSNAYSCYKNSVEHSFDGIDCAFFINEWYNPPNVDENFTMLTFDKIEEPTSTRRSNNVVRTDHYPFEQPHGNIWQRVKKIRNQLPFYKRDKFFVSDMLEDYLFFYSNADITHSDRIHACLPTLAYGNKAKFWFESPRGALFDRVLNKDISKQAVTLDQDRIESLKTEQVSEVRKIVEAESVI